MAIDKIASREWRRQIRDVLNRDWDPIGVAAESPDEYDSYAGTIAAMIREEQATDEQIMNFLEWAEVENMALPPLNRERATKVISALRELGGPPASI